MVEKRIEPDLIDSTKEDNKQFTNLFDPLRWNKLIHDFNNLEDKRSLGEMFKELVEGP